jgi:hypothetical protein
MKNSNEVCLNLEVLEDRIALSGAFGGAIQSGIPVFPQSPFTALAAAQSASIGQPQPGFRNSFGDFNSQTVNPVSNFQNQLQSFQAAQVALIDQFFSDVQSLLQHLNLQTVLII